MCVSISATVQLGCLFVPKVYIVLFQPHKNVRTGAKGSIGLGSSGAGRPFFGRQSSRFSGIAAMTNGDITSPSNVDSDSMGEMGSMHASMGEMGSMHASMGEMGGMHTSMGEMGSIHACSDSQDLFPGLELSDVYTGL